MEVTIRPEPAHAELKARQRAEREGFPPDFGLRVHRAISWIGRAEAAGDDPDAAFIFLWIAFNAAYARDIVGDERERFRSFFERIAAIDSGQRIWRAVWERFPGPIRLFIDNRYVFAPFWAHWNAPEAERRPWEDRFAKARKLFARAIEVQDTALILSMLFDRLYVLRNQLMHGGATWNSAVNRDQVRDGARILACVVPTIVDLMMDHPTADWGRPYYPVVED